MSVRGIALCGGSRPACAAALNHHADRNWEDQERAFRARAPTVTAAGDITITARGPGSVKGNYAGRR